MQTTMNLLRKVGAEDPFFDSGMQGYLLNTARENLWRVPSSYELHDLVEDGLVCYYKCRRRYTTDLANRRKLRQVTARSHLMALVQTAFGNHINTLAAKNRNAAQPVSQLTREDGNEAQLDDYAPPQPELGTFATLMASAPAEIKQLLALLMADAGFQWKRHRRKLIRETNNERFCRLLGKDPAKADIAGFVKAYFA